MIDGLTVLAGVDFNAPVLAFEVLEGGERLCFEGVESQFHALHIIVTPARVFGARQDALFEHVIGTFKVEHFGESGIPTEGLMPHFQIGQRAREAIEEEIVPAGRPGDVLHRVFEQRYDDCVGRQNSPVFLAGLGVDNLVVLDVIVEVGPEG